MTDFEYQGHPEDQDLTGKDLIFLEKLGCNSVTMRGETYSLLRLGGRQGGVEDTTSLYVMRLDDVAALISVLLEQAVRDKQGRALYAMLVDDLAKLKYVRPSN